jgi:Uma2 family endonuclease
MSITQQRPMTREQFLSWEAKQDLRYEFDGFQPVPMTGGTAAHAVIQHNLHTAVGGRLGGGPCRFYGSDLKIETSTASGTPTASWSARPSRQGRRRCESRL